MNFRSLLTGFAYALNSSECLVCLTCVLMESCLGDNIRSIVLFLSFPKCPIALILVVEISSYELAKWNDKICPHLGRDVFLVLFSLVRYRIILI
jgi:TctA family transporter